MVSVPAEFGKIRVLIVDDEEYNRILFKTIFGRWGVEHSEAPDGRAALEILERERFDLVIMDMRMPDLDGAETTQRIRNELKISDSSMPVICVSAGFSEGDIERYRKSGMNAFLLKPFSERSLAEAVLSVTGPGGDPGGPGAESPAGSIDLSSLRHIAGGDEKFVREMLTAFIADAERGIDEMADLLKKADGAGIAEISHKLIPKFRHLGAVEMASLLAGIETAGREGSEVSKVELLVRRLQESFPDIRREIEDHLSENG